MDKRILFSIDIPTISGQKFNIVRFTGYEALSNLYHFNIVLVGDGPVISGSQALDQEATLTHHANAGSYSFHGIFSRFELLDQANGLTYYRALLVPRLWRATLDCNSKIFLNKSIPDCLEECLRELDFSEGTDFDLRLQRKYAKREYISQYNESTYAFLSRWMEHAGIYYYFDHSGQREKLVLTDTSIAHQNVSGASALQYVLPSGLEKEHEETSVPRLHAKHNLVPKTLQVQDYNYRTPNLKIHAEKTVSADGIGTVYSYADNIKTVSEAEALAAVRAESLACKQFTCDGESASPFIRAGWLFQIQGYYDASVNTAWLATDVHHGGNQEGYLFSGATSDNRDTYFYRNTFTAIPASVQFRSENTTPRPKMDGAFGAHIDAAGSGQYAELDEHGRYKITMPWDRSGRQDGKASHWVRMAQPYGGGGHGMHFPLHKGTEALLGYVDGDPDRPIIEGAAPDPEHPSQVTAETQTQCRITTKAQNKLHIEDKSGSQRMVMNSTKAKTYVRMGAHNDPPPDWSKSDDMAGWKLSTPDWLEVEAGSKNSVILGNQFETILGWEHRQTGGIRTKTVIGLNLALVLAYTHEFAPFEGKIHALGVYLGLEKSKLIDEHTEVAEERMETAEEKIKMANNAVKVQQMHTSLAEQKTKVAMNKTSMTENRSQLAEQSTELFSNYQDMHASGMRAVQEATSAAETKMETVMEKVEVAENSYAAAMGKVVTAAEEAEVAESVSEVSSSKATMAAEQNDM